MCFLETILRDRREGLVDDLPVDEAELTQRLYAEISTTANLRLVDLRADNAVRMGVPTDVIRAQRQNLARWWSVAFYEHPSKPDGIMYPSRLNGATNLAIYDRATKKLQAKRVVTLLGAPGLAQVVNDFRVRASLTDKTAPCSNFSASVTPRDPNFALEFMPFCLGADCGRLKLGLEPAREGRQQQADDGAKALSKAIRATFGKDSLIQRCQVHKARNIMDRLPKELHAATRRALRQAWELDDADKAEKLIRNLARRLDQERPGVAASILEGLDEILTVVRLKLPMQLRRSLACTNIAENMMGTIRRVTRNVKRWRNGRMALRWVAAGMMEAAKGFRKLKAHKQLPILRAALIAHQNRLAEKPVAPTSRAA